MGLTGASVVPDCGPQVRRDSRWAQWTGADRRLSWDKTVAIELDQWLELSGEQRVRIREQMRQEVFCTHEQRLERVLRVAEHPVD